MKTSLLLIIAAFMAFSLPAQTGASVKSPGNLKSASVARQKLDSVLVSSWDTVAAQWNPGSKSDYAYDTDGNMILSYSYGWMSSTQVWKARSKFVCNYDSTGLLTYNENYAPDTVPGTWKASTEHEYSYDPNRNMVSDIQLNWSNDSGRLIYSSRYDYSYNLQGRMTSKLGSVVNGRSQWQIQTQNNFTYDSSGNLTLELAYEMNSVNHQWYPSYRNENSYDSAGNKVRIIYSLPDTGAANWKYESKSDYSFNSSRKMILETDYQFSATDSIWNPLLKEVRTYSDTGDMTMKFNYNWDVTNSQWVPVSDGKMICDFNIAFPLEQLILPPGFENYNSDHMMMDKFQYHWNGSQWNQFVRNSYYYSEKNLGIPENSLSYCRVYPNPTRDHINIDWPGLTGDLQISIYNQNGVMVFSRKVAGRSTVNFGNLPEGEYILKITGDHQTTTTKLIIQ